MSIWTQADLDSAKAALLQIIATGGPVQVRLASGESITYADVAVLAKLVSEMARDIGASTGRRIPVYIPEIR